MIVLVGTIAGFSLPIAQYPQISPPTVAVSASYTGASAAVVNETVAQVIEEQVNGTQGMDYMDSTSDDTGRYSLSVTFEVGTDGDMDAVKVQNKRQSPVLRAVRRRDHAQILGADGVLRLAVLRGWQL